MNTTTKCQHALVFGTLTLLLVILACVAFLAPVTDYSSNVVEPVTQVVTNPTSYTTRRRGSTNRYGYDYEDDDNYSTQRGETRSTRSTRFLDRSTASTARHGGGATSQQDEATVGPNPDPNVRSDTPVASLYPSSGNRRTKRAANDGGNGYNHRNSDMNDHGNDHGKPQKSDRRMKDESMGHMKMTRNKSLPRGEQMQMSGVMGGLVPGEIYAVLMHQHGDLQNGCSQLGPELGAKPGMKRNKRSSRNGLSREEQEEIRDWKDTHNGSLIGFFQANETGYGNFSHPVPLAYQDVCSCDGATGRAVNVRPATGVPDASMAGGPNKKQDGHRPQKSGGRDNSDTAEEFMNMMRGRKKREAHNEQNEYHHKRPHMKKGRNEMDGMGEGMKKGRMNEMNAMARDGRLNGRNMHKHMGAPTACGVFGRG